MSEHTENITDIQLTPCRPEDKSGVVLVPKVQAFPTASTADYDDNNAKAVVDNGAQRKRRTKQQLLVLKEALAKREVGSENWTVS